MNAGFNRSTPICSCLPVILSVIPWSFGSITLYGGWNGRWTKTNSPSLIALVRIVYTPRGSASHVLEMSLLLLRVLAAGSVSRLSSRKHPGSCTVSPKQVVPVLRRCPPMLTGSLGVCLSSSSPCGTWCWENVVFKCFVRWPPGISWCDSKFLHRSVALCSDTAKELNPVLYQCFCRCKHLVSLWIIVKQWWAWDQ